MKWTSFSIIIILGLLVIILLQRSCIKPKVITKEVTNIEVIYDTIFKETVVYKPIWKTRTEVKIDTMTSIDTIKVLGDYYAKYYYEDSLVNDTLKFYINDTITQNNISSRKLSYSLILPTNIITIDNKKTKFYYGFGLGGNTTELSHVDAKLLMINKKDNGYLLNIGINNQIEPIIGVGVLWKIGKNE